MQTAIEQSSSAADWDARLRDLASQYPDDVFVQQAYINSTAIPEERLKRFSEYNARHEKNSSEDAQWDYLNGLALVGSKTPEAIKLFDAALEKSPEFALPHLEFVTIYGYPVFLDPEKRLTHLKAFLDACPNSIDGYRKLANISDNDVLKAYDEKFRTVLKNRTDMDGVSAYPILWSLEFKVHPPAEQAQVREQVAQDLLRIQALKFEDKPAWWRTLITGYQIVGDDKQAAWANEQIESRFPDPSTSPEITKWFEEHPEPNAETTPAAIQAYYRDLLSQTSQWAANHRPRGSAQDLQPSNLNVVIQQKRLNAMEHLDDVPAADVETAVNDMFKFTGKYGPYTGEGVYSLAAEVLAEKHIDPQRLIEIVQKRLSMPDSQILHDYAATKDRAAAHNVNESETRAWYLDFEAQGYIELRNAAKAESTLQQIEETLNEQEPLAAGRQDWNQYFLSEKSTYWGLMARLAKLQGRKQDAMAYFESALLTRTEAKETIEGKDELAEQAHELWTNLGGTETAWNTWYGRGAAAVKSVATLTWEDTKQPLPAFRLTDLDGKTWTLADLKGKEVVLTFWATWCGPCNSELPELQKLIEQNKNPGVIFVTVSTDENPGLVEPFMKKHNFTFTVWPAHSYAAETLKVLAIPQNWVVDASGIVRLKGVGYDSTKKWREGMADVIQKFAPAEATAASTPTSRK